jgi:hypothetical protein
MKPLVKGKGFSTRFTRTPIDKTALQSVYKVLGKDACEQTLRGWHRPSVTLELVKQAVMDFSGTSKPRLMDAEYISILRHTMAEFKPEKPIVPFSLGAAILHPDFPRMKSPGLPYI